MVGFTCAIPFRHYMVSPLIGSGCVYVYMYVCVCMYTAVNDVGNSINLIVHL